jgi:hypothetical protein
LDRVDTVIRENCQESGCHIGLQHRVEHAQRRSRLMAQRRDPAGPRVEQRIALRGFGERTMFAIVAANAVAQLPIRGRATETFNPTVFVRRHCLGCQLATDPVGLFGQNCLKACPTDSHSRGASAYPSSDNQNVSVFFACHEWDWGVRDAGFRVPAKVRWRAIIIQSIYHLCQRADYGGLSTWGGVLPAAFALIRGISRKCGCKMIDKLLELHYDKGRVA